MELSCGYAAGVSRTHVSPWLKAGKIYTSEDLYVRICALELAGDSHMYPVLLKRQLSQYARYFSTAFLPRNLA